MAYTLNKNPKVKYSQSEIKVFKILSRYNGKNKLPTTQIVSWDYFGGLSELPFHAQTITGVNIRSLRRKLEANKEPFKVERIKRPGKNVMWKLERIGKA